MRLQVLAAAILVTCHAPAFGALNAYIHVVGQKQGLIRGTAPGDSILLTKFSTQEVVTVNELKTHTLANGHRQWKPLTFNVKSGPWVSRLLYTKSNAEAVTMDLTVLETKPNSPAQISYKVHFDGAHIQQVANKTVDGQEEVQVSFTFTKITWTWTNGGKTFSDSWVEGG